MGTLRESSILTVYGGYIGNRKPCTGCNKCGKYNQQIECDVEPLLPTSPEFNVIKKESEDMSVLLPTGISFCYDCD
jgi:hypothetical protein